MTADLMIIATQDIQSYFQQRKDYFNMCVCAQRQYVMGQQATFYIYPFYYMSSGKFLILPSNGILNTK